MDPLGFVNPGMDFNGSSSQGPLSFPETPLEMPDSWWEDCDTIESDGKFNSITIFNSIYHHFTME